MGRVKLNKKFESYTGKLPPNGHRFYLTNRYGETIISHCPIKRDPDTISDKQRASMDELAQARAIADAELADPVKREEWLQQWRRATTLEGKEYKTMRGYTIAKIRKKLQ